VLMVDGTVAWERDEIDGKKIFDGWLRERGAVRQENFRLWGAITHLTTEAGGGRQPFGYKAAPT
jgi:hypothetical protein